MVSNSAKSLLFLPQLTNYRWVVIEMYDPKYRIGITITCREIITAFVKLKKACTICRPEQVS